MTHSQSCAGEEDSAVGVLRIRAMNPEDIDQVVGLHLDCFEGHLLVSLGARLLRLYYQAMLAEPATVALVSEDKQGRIIGFAAGTLAIGVLYSRLLTHDFPAILLATTPTLVRHPLLCRRVLRALVLRLVNPRVKGAATLSSFAVEPRARGVGAGTNLFRAFVAEVRTRGGVLLVWGAKATDDSARPFYARMARITGAISSRIAGEHVTYRMAVRDFPPDL